MSGSRFARLPIVCAVLLTCAAAAAQEPPADRRFGLTVGYPASSSPAGGVIGLIWQRSDRLALRPEVSFNSTTTSTNHSWFVGATLTTLCYVHPKDGVIAYVGPRLAYTRSTSGGSVVSSTYGIGGTAGLQYALTRRIGLYGEIGLGYAYARFSSVSVGGGAHNISSRSSVGLNLYF